jgi:hypothetical protein
MPKVTSYVEAAEAPEAVLVREEVAEGLAASLELM